MESGYSRSIIIEEFDSEFEKTMHEKDKFITKWETFDYKYLPKNYFQFIETTGYVFK